MRKILYTLLQSALFLIISLCYIIGELTDTIGKELIDYLDYPDD